MATVAPLAWRALEAPASRPSGLSELDALLRDPDARGFVVIEAAGAVLDAVGRHVERRVRAGGRALVKADGLSSDDPWRELVSRFTAPAGDAQAAAQATVDHAGNAVLVVRDGAPTAYGRALSNELARLMADGPCRSLLLRLVEPAGRAQEVVAVLARAGAPRTIELEADVSPDDLGLWWEAVAREVASRGAPGLARLDALEAWWAAARATPRERRAEAPLLSAGASRLLARLSLSQRSWPASQVSRLGSVASADELVEAGVLAVDEQGWLVAGSTPAVVSSAGRDDLPAVAVALEELSDPWASARASELYAAAEMFDRAEGAALRGLSRLGDAAARSDLWARWERTLSELPEAEAVPRLLRSADLALHGGEVERALALAHAARARRSDSFATLLMLGRAELSRGDLPAASCWLGKALGRGEGERERAMVEVELAEVRLMDGDLDGARSHAEAATGASVEPSTQLHARNVLGKILLATSAWRAAEEHFAADACEAALAGDVQAELRARLNRSIALFSSGRLDEARAMLGEVLAEGEGRGELHAVAYALTNLAAIAILKREYAEALRVSERAFETRQRIGDRVKLAHVIANLAELKLLLGLVPEAEQTLAFGRKACAAGMPRARAAHFALTAALIHLERRRTVEASAELKIALRTAGGADNGALLGECHRTAARVALEDGDLAAAEAAIAQASAVAEAPRERAWVALLEAARARAAGEAFDELAAEALERARLADDPELLREAHLSAHHAATLAGDDRAARAHLDAALSVRDQIAGSLPEGLRRRYLARRDLSELARLDAGGASSEACALTRRSALPAPALSSCGPSLPPVTLPRSRQETPLPALRRMVGRAPAMLALATAIQKVGASDATVLVHGESGTGKELVAEAIHEASARRAGPIVKVNCAALVETLLLSELFGHEKGSFTGAAARRRGRFEVAEGGTLFLDEIGDISPRTQVALLRVLQDKTFERVGGVTPIRANVRIVCATHRDLAAMVARGEFREDLYYRLRGLVLEVPALRQRTGDLGLIAAAILERVAAERGTAPKRLSTAALAALARYPWPGNVRELENALRAAALFAEGDTLELPDFTNNVVSLRGLAEASAGEVTEPAPTTLPTSALDTEEDGGTLDACEVPVMAQASKSALSSGGDATEVAYAAVRGGVSLSDLKRDIERECIARALSETGGNITRAAGLLGMKRPRLSQLVKQYGFGSGGGSGVEAEDGE